MSPVPAISATQARRLALAAQGLDGSFSPPHGPDGTAAICERLGYVQIDTIAVVARAHHHILWSRQRDYAEDDLDHVLAVDRRVFEGWSHAASFIPTSDYRFYLHAMRSHAASQRTIEWVTANKQIVHHVRDRISAEGPLRAADFADDRGKRGPWWDWKPAKGALEILLSSGELMISRRQGFQRFYDLTDRVLPGHVDTTLPTQQERAVWALDRALSHHGVAGVAQLRVWNRNPESLRITLQQSLEQGAVTEVRVRGDDGPPLYVRTDSLEQLAASARPQSVHLLSPFDNLVIRRPWVQRLFEFDYTIECYVPAPKREFGYFCLPVLWGNRFVGRLDAKAERKKESLALRRMTFEPDLAAKQMDRLLPKLAAELWSFARFNQCHRIRVDAVRPTACRTALRQAIKDTRP